MHHQIQQTFRSLIAGETDLIANAANGAALLYWTLPKVNWVGFYFLKDGELVLGPFQGKVACVRIKLGQGVCGTAAERCTSVVVRNVHEFPGHIACDSASNSEVVVPMISDGALLGVLDIDSPEFGRFDEEDARELEKFVEILINNRDDAENTVSAVGVDQDRRIPE